jgi:hypothetical protein
MLRGCERLQFSVIESYRENGKVKHRTLAYLASLPEDCIKFSWRVVRFWDTCDEKLERFPKNERLRLIARIEAEIPRPDEETYADGRKMNSLISKVELAMTQIKNLT